MQVLTEEERSEAMVEVRKILAELREYLMHGPVLIEQEPISEATVTALREAAARINQDYDVMVPIEQEALQTVSDHIVSTAIYRLCWLMELSDGERAFVMAAAEDATDEVTLAAFADWLEEEGRGDDDGVRIRRLIPKPGDLITISPALDSSASRMKATRLGVRMERLLKHRGVIVLLVAHGIRLGHFSEEQILSHGYVREDVYQDALLENEALKKRIKALEGQVADFLEPRKP